MTQYKKQSIIKDNISYPKLHFQCNLNLRKEETSLLRIKRAGPKMSFT